MTGNIDWTKLITKEMKDSAAVIQLIAKVVAEQARLKSLADKVIQPLQDDHDTGDATDEDEALLIAWKRYRSALAKIQLQPGYPKAVDWPVPPA
ncbi:tail fiber assembly protein [Pseudomonas sp. PS02290]|uniref:tail fiber assembly protein n=1 Tax=Pseudomonas sp. PS02290 TaxID=2991430 RepID=UPI002499D5DA|nr:tail fiber assembly protein [Pseudomonas sp. PS02290]